MKTTIKTVLLGAILILFTSFTFGNNERTVTSENENFSLITVDVESILELENWMVDYHTWNNIATKEEKRRKHRSHKDNMRHNKYFSDRSNFTHKANIKKGYKSEITPEKLYKIADMMEKRAEMIRKKASLIEKQTKE